jgi:hypothetical protein
MPSRRARAARDRDTFRWNYIYRPLLIAFPLATLYYLFIPLPTSSSDMHKLISLLIFASPLILYAVLSLLFLLSVVLVLIYAHIRLVSAIWIPLFTVAGLWLYFAPDSAGVYRAQIAWAIVGLPFLLVYAYIFLAFMGFYATLLAMGLIYLFYAALWWRWVAVRPRFRGNDRFDSTSLCEDCRTMLGGSGLLFGKWWFLTRSVESYGFAPKGAMQLRSSGTPLCHLCFLLSREASGIRTRSALRDAMNGRNGDGYGTIAEIVDRRHLSHSESGQVAVNFKTEWWGLDPDDLCGSKRFRPASDCCLQVRSGQDQTSRSLRIVTGK